MRRALPLVATGLATVAVVLAVIAVVSVTNRSSSAMATTPATPAPQSPATAPPAAPQIAEVQVEAADLAKLYVATLDDAPGGMRIDDPALATTLGLQPDDVITSVQGTAVQGGSDVRLALKYGGRGPLTKWYLEIVRRGAPLVVRYHITGNLDAAVYEIILSAQGPQAPPPPPPPPPAVPDPLLATITKVDDDHYEIPQKTLDALLADPSTLATSMRVTASVKNGTPNGVKLYAIRPSSPVAHLGFANGDTVHAVNGTPLDLTTIFTAIPRKGVLVFDITRRGLDQTLTITITP